MTETELKDIYRKYPSCSNGNRLTDLKALGIKNKDIDLSDRVMNPLTRKLIKVYSAPYIGLIKSARDLINVDITKQVKIINAETRNSNSKSRQFDEIDHKVKELLPDEELRKKESLVKKLLMKKYNLVEPNKELKKTRSKKVIIKSSDSDDESESCN